VRTRIAATLFVFRSKRMDRVKLLAWDGSGMVLVTKWLHEGRFTWPRSRTKRGCHLRRRARPYASDLLDGPSDWTRGLAKICEGKPAIVGLRPEDFTGAYGERDVSPFVHGMIRPEALPTDAAALT